MKSFTGAVALFVLWVSVSAFSAETPLTLVVGSKTTTLRLRDLQKKLTNHAVTIEDPVYHAQKKFDGFDLIEVLRLGGLDEKVSYDELVFTAIDGYSPNVAYAQLKKRRAYLVFRESGKAPFTFGKVDQGKAKVSPAPYYVVWEGAAAEGEVPWPYQLVKIEAVSFLEKFGAVYPKGMEESSGAYRGFLIFKQDCIRCHSVNLQGGDLGPELNVPKNVTEYWEKKTLREFIENPSAFRAKSKMPPFPQLKGEGIDNILAYLEAMKARKVSP